MTKKLKVVVLMGGKSSEREVSMSSGREVLANIDRKKYFVTPIEIPLKGNNWVNKLLKNKPDVVFIALHGNLGEDGTMQGMLTELGIPYTGCGVLASAIGMDKILFKKIMRQEKIPIPKDVTNAPCFVKPGDQGSSVGASLVLARKDIGKAIKLAKKYSENILIEEYIKGVELTCGVLGNKNLQAIHVV
jgi:D-alanine-D-alanine ligase